MNRQKLLADQSVRKALAGRLSKCPDVTKFNKGDEKEAGVLAHAFGDLEESFCAFLDEQLPRLMDDQASPAELFDALLDIGEEFRHILYHIHDPRFYRYLDDQPGDDES
jgi:hypothetical protein